MLDSNDAFEIFIRSHLHFTKGTFNFFKSNLKHVKNKYPGIFEKATSIFLSSDHFLGFCVANKLKNTQFFVGDLFDPTCNQYYLTWKNQIGNVEETLLNDLKTLKKNNVSIIDNKQLLLSKLIIKQWVSWDSLLLLDSVYSILSNRISPQQSLLCDFEYEVAFKLKKYKPFFNYFAKQLSPEHVKNNVNYVMKI